jgi:hypothetical protein
MEHALHLAAGHVLSHITPVRTEKTRRARNDDDDDNDNDDEETYAGAASSDNCSTVISNAVHKMLGLIKQVSLICCIAFVTFPNTSFRYENHLKLVLSSSGCVARLMS